jgi:hypothetical protein
MTTEIKFWRPEIQTELLISRIKEDQSLKRIFMTKKDVTKIVNDDLQQRTRGLIDNFYTIFILGTQGTMKSSLAQTISAKFDPTFNSQRICFQYDEYKKKLEASNPKETLNLDEQVFQQGTGATRLLNEIQETIETLRKRGNSLIICSPTKKYFPEELFTYTLETIDTAITATCAKNNKPHEPRTCTCWEEKTSIVKDVYVRAIVKSQGIYIGFYIAKIDWMNQTWQEYSINKDKFIETITSGKKTKEGYETIAEQLLKIPENTLYTNRKQLKIFVEKHKTNLTVSETELVIESIRMARKAKELQKEKDIEQDINTDEVDLS